MNNQSDNNKKRKKLKSIDASRNEKIRLGLENETDSEFY